MSTEANGGRHLRIGVQPLRQFSESPLEALLTVDDITDVRRTVSFPAKIESALAADKLIENLGATVWVVEVQQMNFVFVSKSGRSLLGFDTEHWLSSPEFWRRRVHPDDRERVLRTYRAAVEDPESSASEISCEYRAITSSNRTIWLLEIARIQYDSPGRPRYLIGITVDITQRRHFERQLVQSNRRNAIGRLAGRLLHDLNNLLMIVTGYGEELLESLPVGNPLRGDIQQILTAGERVGALTNQLLAFTRRHPVSPTTIELGGALRDMEISLQRRLGDNIGLKLQAIQHRINVRADLTQFQQIMVAFARRARGAMPGGGLLSIGIKRTNIGEYGLHSEAPLRPGEYAIVAIQDDGPQYDHEARAVLFESCFGADQEDQEIGPLLAQAYALVRQWGGDISVEPAAPTGEIFQIYLPIVPESIQPSVPVAEQGPGSRKGTILVVDDEEGIRLLIGKILRHQGYRVLEAKDGQHAIEIFQTHRGTVDLVIADVTMPEMDGLQLVEHLRKLQDGIKVLYISGYTPDVARCAPDLAQGRGFLRKPFTLGALQDKVKELIAVK
jgi:PAS domain S-box-containing protein